MRMLAAAALATLLSSTVIAQYLGRDLTVCHLQVDARCGYYYFELAAKIPICLYCELR